MKYVVYRTNDAVTIVGTGFPNNVRVLIGEYGIITTFTSKSSTQLVFNFPSVPAGTHRIIVEDPVNGYATGSWNARVNLEVRSFTPTSGSIGGQKVTISGGGFNTQQNVNDSPSKRELPTIYLGTAACLNVQVVNSETITCVTARRTSDGNKAIIVKQKNSITLGYD